MNLSLNETGLGFFISLRGLPMALVRESKFQNEVLYNISVIILSTSSKEQLTCISTTNLKTDSSADLTLGT